MARAPVASLARRLLLTDLPVTEWPSYLLKGIPPTRRRWLSKCAATWDVSVADVVRSVLCDRLSLSCPPMSGGYDRTRDTKSSTTILIRMQPKLDKALEREVARTGHSKRRVILDAIDDRYKKGDA